MAYKNGTAKVGRLLKFHASSATYTVIVIESVNGLALVTDAEGRWVASMPRDILDNEKEIAYYLKQAGRNELDATNIAQAIIADRDYLFSQA